MGWVLQAMMGSHCMSRANQECHDYQRVARSAEVSVPRAVRPPDNHTFNLVAPSCRHNCPQAFAPRR
ncbi:MAG: hypothetical protein COW59_12540 [Lysobacterales bacterium CG17_big_fil_post_rev_8_21_14_2_50_64_11]|nr:MAG: hypothetical protein COW59_12540 [Xanthomonadales bacterium CG17_big_fil_post_rev_8_21_14_2_50_64_11]PIX60849.1 MAG: hypothetical protein COZ47_05160 [Xanthomonadales bacterium CG_4_10_14_3_um_filter_64_11]